MHRQITQAVVCMCPHSVGNGPLPERMHTTALSFPIGRAIPSTSFVAEQDR
jgi:hypothetical protein